MIKATEIQACTLSLIVDKLANTGIYLADVKYETESEFEKYTEANLNLIGAMNIITQVLFDGWPEVEDLK